MISFKTLQFTLLFFSFTVINLCCFSQNNNSTNLFDKGIKTGAEQIDKYLGILENKRVGIVANHSSKIGDVHIVDTLLSLGVNLIKIYSPEHGFRGDIDAGMKYEDYRDEQTGLQVVSLYGKNRKPSSGDVENVDIMLFDIQDVGVRFYTYISTMHYVMEVCAKENISFVVLDRPNPNGFYVDGPVLKEKYSSFIGMHPVPIVHGMTVAEYAYMINEEGWLENGLYCNLKWILCNNYDHTSKYKLPVNPSPNLQDMRAIYLYPSLGLFEGTVISVGRGTNMPFTVFGNPELQQYEFEFIPESRPGYSKNPKHKGLKCKGFDLRSITLDSLQNRTAISLGWIRKAYLLYPHKERFFTSFFNYLAGRDELKKQIEKGISEKEIRKSWKEELDQYKRIRKKYLLYPDF